MHVQFVVPFLKDAARSYSRRLPIVVGRSAEAKFRIPLDSVSRKHCEVFEKDGCVFVRDLGSTNGTLLDGELVAIAVPTRVRPGGMIQVGGVAIRIEYEPATAGRVADDPTEIRVTRLPAGGFADAPRAVAAGERDVTDVVEPHRAPRQERVPEEPCVAEQQRVAEQQCVTERNGGDAASPANATPESREATGLSFLGSAAVAEVSPDDDDLGTFFKSLA